MIKQLAKMMRKVKDYRTGIESFEVGDYVFASEREDCKPQHGWAVGTIIYVKPSVVFLDTDIPDSLGAGNSRYPWPYALKITQPLGRQVIKHWDEAEFEFYREVLIGE